MKAARLFGPNDLRIIDMPEPHVNEGYVLVKVKFVGICGTDYSIYSGESSFVKNGEVKFPMTLGHEWSGVIVKIGKGVKKLKEGDRVIGDAAVSCGICYECLCGRYYQCDSMKPVGTINAWDGAYAEYILMPERHVFKFSDNVTFEHAALVEPAATALYAIERGNIKPGDIVLIHGTGPIGLSAVHLAKATGAACVILSGRNDYKLSVGKKLGADIVVNILKEDLGKVVMSVTGGKGAHIIIEASGSMDALQNSFKMIKPGGTISLVAFYNMKMNDFNIDSFVFNDIKLIAVSGSPMLGVTILEMMKYDRINLLPIITHTYPIEQVLSALYDMTNNNDMRIKILLEVS